MLYSEKKMTENKRFFPCKQCDNETFETFDDLVSHQKEEHELMKKLFGIESDLKRYLQSLQLWITECIPHGQAFGRECVSANH